MFLRIWIPNSYLGLLGVIVGWASLVAQRLKHLPAMRETWVRSLGWEDPLEKEMATHSSIHAWKIPWTEKPTPWGSKESDMPERLYSLQGVCLQETQVQAHPRPTRKSPPEAGCLCPAARSCLNLCNPMGCSPPGSSFLRKAPLKPHSWRPLLKDRSPWSGPEACVSVKWVMTLESD